MAEICEVEHGGYIQEILDDGLGFRHDVYHDMAIVNHGRSGEVLHINETSRYDAMFHYIDETGWSIIDNSAEGLYLDKKRVGDGVASPLANGVIISLGRPEVSRVKYIFKTHAAAHSGKQKPVASEKRRLRNSKEENTWSSLPCTSSGSGRKKIRVKPKTADCKWPLSPNQLLGSNEDRTRNEAMMVSELTCSICTELFIKATTLLCGHSFCRYCIGTWRRHHNSCPTCRKPVEHQTEPLIINRIIENFVATLSSEYQDHRNIMVTQRTAEERRWPKQVMVSIVSGGQRNSSSANGAEWSSVLSVNGNLFNVGGRVTFCGHGRHVSLADCSYSIKRGNAVVDFFISKDANLQSNNSSIHHSNNNDEDSSGGENEGQTF